ncbi:MAG: BamA/TamA family outer membrane protein [Gemmatimonadota bacterium]
MDRGAISLLWAVVAAAVLVGAGVAQSPAPASGDRSVELRDLERPKVKRIRFEHLRDKPFAADKLRAAMLTQTGEPFQRRFFRSDLDAIQNLYRGAGYMSVEIPVKSFTLDADGELEIALAIDSGSLWRVERVDVQLLEGDCDIEKLRRQLRVREKESFHYGDVLADERRLLTTLNTQGFALARVRNRLSLDSDHSRATVVYEVRAGRRMYIGPIALVPRGAAGGALHTRPGLIRRYLTFSEGQLYDPEKLRRSRTNLSRTDLFRSVTFNTPAVAAGDSVQPVEVMLQERQYIHLEANAFLNNTQPGVSANVQHSNWLGRGTRLGLDASLGQPLQGSTVYLTERNVLDSGADLTVSGGMTDEWSSRRVLADPTDSLQFELLSANDSVLNELVLGFGREVADAYIAASVLEYPSVERVLQFTSSLDRRLERGVRTVYEVTLATSWRNSRNWPQPGKQIRYNALTLDQAGGGAGADTSGTFPSDDPFGDDPFGDGPFGDGGTGAVDGGAGDPGASSFPYDSQRIPVDGPWGEILTDRSKTLNFSLALQRDTRDNQISPRRGTFLRAAGLYAFQFGGQAARVVDGDGEARQYTPLGPHLVWAVAGRLRATASLRQDRALPQTYWQFLGGEGSVRGVKRDGLQAVGGGRLAANLRNELRVQKGAVGVVLFWDRGGVWRNGGDARWASMTNGYGLGFRYDMGIPFRLDMGWSDRYRRRDIYFSIGQAF